MLKSLYTTATGMKAQQTMVDTIAHNIANVNTAGFKKSQASFEDLLYVTLQAPGLNQVAGAPSPVGLQIGSGSRLAATTKIYSPGVLEGTGRAQDIAIDGAGFLEVQLADGSSGYTRDGQLQINADGKFVTQSGMVLIPEISVPQDVLDLSINANGVVSGRTGSSPETTTNFGTIQLVRFINPSGLLSEGGNVIRETAASGGVIKGSPGDPGFGSIRQAFIERSNVEIVNELVNLIVAQRAYEVNSKAIQASDQMLQVATNVLR
jgi:flagellar basal-body rod protein FlgG